jgi:hypothetical protein
MSRKNVSLLALVVGIFCSACDSSTPEARVAWRKYLVVSRKMTRSEVHAVMPQGHCSRFDDGTEEEVWIFGNDRNGASMFILYEKDGRIRNIERNLW